ncbi:uncharacterized protein V1510DRAFT_422933 [Dipodascopsis tothii]|uniref:uncharacterized protein n=1 Tax=Dipodascopsis tothii TaxID=44089 RepID=UPI0034CF321D
MAMKRAKLADLINFRMRVTTEDGRQLTGTMLAFDKHMNLVLADCEEFRYTKKHAVAKSQGAEGAADLVEDKRTLGLVVLRGENVVSVSIEAPPANDNSSRLGVIPPGTGTARAVGRGMGGVGALGAAPSLAGPMRTQAPAGFSAPGAPPAGFAPNAPPPAGFAPPSMFGPPGSQ